MDQFLWAFNDFHNHSAGDSTRFRSGEIRKAGRDAANAIRDVEILNEKVEHLELINRAIWELLKECTALTEEDLMQRVRQFDLEAEANLPKMCQACSRPNSVKRRNCLYCGDDLPLNSAFELL